MIPVRGYAARSATAPLAPFNFRRRDPGPKDVLIDILYCGICHSDLHLVRNDWGRSIYPMVPGHEIVGRIVEKGKRVRRFKKGDLAAVGCFVDSCRKCSNCKNGLQQYCTDGLVLTYNSYEKDGKTVTQGGYSTKIVVDEDYGLKKRHRFYVPASPRIPHFVTGKSVRDTELAFSVWEAWAIWPSNLLPHSE